MRTTLKTKDSSSVFGTETSIKFGSICDDLAPVEFRYIYNAMQRRSPFMIEEKVLNYKIDESTIRFFSLEFVRDFMESIRPEFGSLGEFVNILVVKKMNRKLLGIE